MLSCRLVFERSVLPKRSGVAVSHVSVVPRHFHPLPDFGGGPGYQDCPEGLVGFLPHFAVGGASASDAILVVFEAKGCCGKGSGQGSQWSQ